MNLYCFNHSHAQHDAIPGARRAIFAIALLTVSAGLCPAQNGNGQGNAFLPEQVWSISTVPAAPANQDLNPYGVTFVPNDFPVGAGPLQHGDILVSNFNNPNPQNKQGLGTTIVDISAAGLQTLFFQGSGPTQSGLSTALGTLRAGFIVVGNAPTTDGSAATATPGSLLVLNSQGGVVQNITDPTINYPWDMALVDNTDTAIAFITNALDGTVTRLNFSVSPAGLTLQKATTIASGYMHRGDPVTLFVAPTGLVYDADKDVLYVASTGDNAVYAIQNAAGRQNGAGLGQLIYQDNVHLHGALGLAPAPNGHLLVTNNDGINPDPNQPSEIVEFTVQGKFVKQISVDPAQGGSFGLAVNPGRNLTVLAAVDDNTATIDIWHLIGNQN
jgi:hypothetical protein